MGPFSDDRIALLFCIDAIPAFKKKYGVSLMPAVVKFLSLAPQLRSKVEYMMMVMLIPAHLKPAAQKKYFDYLAEVELNDLATIGISHPGHVNTHTIITMHVTIALTQSSHSSLH